MANPNSSYPHGLENEARTLKIDPADREESSTFGKLNPVTERQEVDAFVATLPLPAGGATAANQLVEIANLQALNSLVPLTYDYIALSYTGSDLTTVVFKIGGPAGATVSTLTLAYSASVLQSVTRT